MLEEMVQKENIRVLYHTLVCKAVVENGSIIGVIVENKSGRGFIRAKRVIDSTGDGDVAAFAGVPCYKGRETDGKMQPCTLMFKVGGVDPVRAVYPPSFETTVETEAPALDKKALAESCIEKDISELYALIGEPSSSEYAPSCLVEGEDGTLYYDGFVVYTTREGDVETVYYVE